jgi:hypothetical protein
VSKPKDLAFSSPRISEADLPSRSGRSTSYSRRRGPKLQSLKVAWAWLIPALSFVMQGAVHLVVFAVFLFLAFVP